MKRFNELGHVSLSVCFFTVEFKNRNISIIVKRIMVSGSHVILIKMTAGKKGSRKVIPGNGQHALSRNFCRRCRMDMKKGKLTVEIRYPLK